MLNQALVPEAGLTMQTHDSIPQGASLCRGITNGIDTQEWNPATDKHLPAELRYCASTVAAGKAAAKALFQQQYGLSVNPKVPLIGMVGRLAPEKGVDIVLAALPALLSPPNPVITALTSSNTSAGRDGCNRPVSEPGDCQIAILGAGQSSSHVLFAQQCIQVTLAWFISKPTGVLSRFSSWSRKLKTT